MYNGESWLLTQRWGIAVTINSNKPAVNWLYQLKHQKSREICFKLTNIETNLKWGCFFDSSHRMGVKYNYPTNNTMLFFQFSPHLEISRSQFTLFSFLSAQEYSLLSCLVRFSFLQLLFLLLLRHPKVPQYLNALSSPIWIRLPH